MSEPKMGYEGAEQQQAGLGEFLWGAHSASSKVLEFTAGRSFDDYREHEVLHAAVESMLRIVAASLEDVQDYFPEEAAKLPHAGEAIALKPKLDIGADTEVWRFVQGSLPELVAEVQVLLEAWHSAQGGLYFAQRQERDVQSIITENREKIAELCRAHHVLRLSVFGSAVRDDFDPSRSDVDLLVDFEPLNEMEYAPNYFSLLESFDKLFGREVDLLSSRAVKNPYLRKSIEEDRIDLYAA